MREEHPEHAPALNDQEDPDAAMIQELLRRLNNPQESAPEGPHVQIVVVTLDHALYGIKILAVREILKVPKITWVPWTPEYVIGVISVRGEIQSVVDLKQFLQIGVSRVSEQSRILLVESADLVAGFLVDAMVEIIHVPVASFVPSAESNVTGILRYVEGTLPWNERVVSLLNIDLLLQGVVVNQG